MKLKSFCVCVGRRPRRDGKWEYRLNLNVSWEDLGRCHEPQSRGLVACHHAHVHSTFLFQFKVDNVDPSSHSASKIKFPIRANIYERSVPSVYVKTINFLFHIQDGRKISVIIVTEDYLCYKEPKSPYNFFFHILIFNELFKFKTSDEWQQWKTASPSLNCKDSNF